MDSGTFDPAGVRNFAELYFVTQISALFFFGLKWVVPWALQRFVSAYRQAEDDDERMDWISRVLSTIHAVVMSGTSVFVYFKYSELRVDHDIAFVCKELWLLLGFSYGYFISDCFSIRGNGLEFAMYVTHHIVTMVIIQSLVFVPLYHWGWMMAASCEFSTPFVNNIFFFPRLGLRDSPLFVVNGILIVITWFAFRYGGCIIFFVYVMGFAGANFETVRAFSPYIEYWWWFLTALIAVLNLVWGYKLVRGFYNVIVGKKVAGLDKKKR